MGRLAADKARGVYSRSGHRVADGLVDGNALTGQCRFVDGGVALQDHTVNGDALARTDNENVAELDLLNGDGGLCAVTHYICRFRRKAHE